AGRRGDPYPLAPPRRWPLAAVPVGWRPLPAAAATIIEQTAEAPRMVEHPYLGPILCEEHWQASGDPERMEKFLGERGSRRRWQLFACECCWRILPLLTDDRSRAAVSLAERQAEGLAGPADVADALEEAHVAVLEAWRPVRSPGLTAATMAALYTLSTPRLAFHHAAQAAGSGEPAERLAQCRLLRELFGNPFRPF